MEPVRCGVWGVGTWGEKHARVYSTLPEATLVLPPSWRALVDERGTILAALAG